MVCSRCGETNTEFSTFRTSKYENVDSGVISKVLRWFTVVPLVEIAICQTCQSLMFRGLDKDK